VKTHFFIEETEKNPARLACKKSFDEKAPPRSTDVRVVNCANCLRAVMKEAESYVDHHLDEAVSMLLIVYREAYFNFHKNDDLKESLQRENLLRENKQALAIKVKKLMGKFK
jgi:hypothetical protein